MRPLSCSFFNVFLGQFFTRTSPPLTPALHSPIPKLNIELGASNTLQPILRNKPSNIKTSPTPISYSVLSVNRMALFKEICYVCMSVFGLWPGYGTGTIGCDYVGWFNLTWVAYVDVKHMKSWLVRLTVAQHDEGI